MNKELIDKKITSLMNLCGETCLRLSFGIIFIWFGVLKPLGLSSAEPLVLKTVDWMPFFTAKEWLSIIGYWEILIGVFFLSKKTTRMAILLLFLQMGGTFLPLFILPEITFQKGGNLMFPTMEGQYIIKNLMIISAALVIGGNLGKTMKTNVSST